MDFICHALHHVCTTQVIMWINFFCHDQGAKTYMFLHIQRIFSVKKQSKDANVCTLRARHKAFWGHIAILATCVIVLCINYRIYSGISREILDKI